LEKERSADATVTGDDVKITQAVKTSLYRDPKSFYNIHFASFLIVLIFENESVNISFIDNTCLVKSELISFS